MRMGLQLLLFAVSAVFGVSSATAQTACGYIACEEFLVTYNPGGAPGSFTMSCEPDTSPGHGAESIAAIRTCANTSTGDCVTVGHKTEVNHFGGCNCASKPDWSDPAGPRSFYDSMDSEGTVKKCIAGCTFTPKGNYAADKWMAKPGKYAAFAPDGWKPDGSQCNPFNPGSGDDPGAGEGNCKETASGGDAIVCIEREENEPDAPNPCVYFKGQQVCPNDPNACAGGPIVGITCVKTENHDPQPPAPPQGPPPSRPPDINNPCIINGKPCEIRFWQPPFDEPPCPDGTVRVNGVCVPDEENPRVCPDGSPPRNNECPAPVANCPDGTVPQGNPPRCAAPLADCPDGSRPVNGTCPFSGGTGGVCPDGAQPVNGLCTAQYAACPGGVAPVNGQCAPGYAPCPNGGRPINGMCSLGGPCNPATDPDHCNGNEGGNASGGQTCEGPPACSGDSILCAVLTQQWRTRCSIENAFGTTGPTSDDEGPVYARGDIWGESQMVDGTGLDSSGWLGSGSGSGACPFLPTVSFLGVSFDMSEWIPCNALKILAMLILAGAYLQAAFIIFGGSK